MTVTAARSRRVDLPAEPVSVGRARRFVTATLTGWGCTDLLDAVTLLTSEVVTNALLHGAGPIGLHLVLLDDGVRVEVRDCSPQAPRPRHFGPESGTGRGLALVQAIARSWGTRPEGQGEKGSKTEGKTVWFEVGAG